MTNSRVVAVLFSIVRFIVAMGTHPEIRFIYAITGEHYVLFG